MISLLAIGLGLVAWPLVSRIYPILSSQTLFYPPHSRSVITPQLSTFIEDTLAREKIIGLSIAIIPKYGGEFHSWGYRTEDGDKVTRDTLFRIGSLSKAFCATALGLLMDDFANGRNVTALPLGLTELTWQTRLSDLLPDWQLMDTWASERLNLRDILSHVSGLPRHEFSYGPLDTPQELIKRLRYLRPAFELRERFSYNNIMYMVATHVIATFSGQSYTSFVEERIFIPLGMTSSTFFPIEADVSGKLSQAWTKRGRRLPGRFTEDIAPTMAGPVGIISSAVDMAKWTSAWIGQGIYDNRTVFPHSVYQNMSHSHSVVAGQSIYPRHSIIGYGMGWYHSSYGGHAISFHTGAMPGFSTLVSFLPNDKIGAVLFANGEGKEKTLTLILNHILDSVLRMDSLPLSGSSLLNPIDTQPSPSSPKSTASEFDGNLTLSLDFSGNYVNPGYGSFALCSTTDTSSSCIAVQSDFFAVDGRLAATDLLANWPRAWSLHLRLRHLHGLVFEIYFTSLYPNGYGKDTRPFETRDPNVDSPHGLAKFVIENGVVVGFGINGLVGKLTERERTHGTVRDRAEVWFDKV